MPAIVAIVAAFSLGMAATGKPETYYDSVEVSTDSSWPIAWLSVCRIWLLVKKVRRHLKIKNRSFPENNWIEIREEGWGRRSKKWRV